MVTLESAKLLCAGSIPAQASRCSRNVRVRVSGGIGIRARLKIVSRKGCGFDAHLTH